MSQGLMQILSAASFAAKRHRDQRRKDPEASPYVNHSIEVASVLANDGGVTDVNLLTAALLHDTVEDTETSFEELSTLFGDDVRDLVREVTDDKSLPKQRRKQLQVENASDKSGRARQLKIADKICNVRDINARSPAGWDAARKMQYLDWAALVVVECRGVNSRLDTQFDQALREARERLNPESRVSRRGLTP